MPPTSHDPAENQPDDPRTHHHPRPRQNLRGSGPVWRSTSPSPRLVTSAENQTQVADPPPPLALSSKPTLWISSPPKKQKNSGLRYPQGLWAVWRSATSAKARTRPWCPMRFSKGLWSAPRKCLDGRHASTLDCADTPPAPPPSTSPDPPETSAENQIPTLSTPPPLALSPNLTLWISSPQKQKTSGLRYPQGLWAVWRSARTPERHATRHVRPMRFSKGLWSAPRAFSTVGMPSRSTARTLHQPRHRPQRRPRDPTSRDSPTQPLVPRRAS